MIHSMKFSLNCESGSLGFPPNPLLAGSYCFVIFPMTGNPLWLNITLAVFPFVAGAVGFTASANTDAAVNGEGWDRRIDGSMADYATEDEAVEVEDN